MFIETTTETIPLWSQRWVPSPFGRGGYMQDYKVGTQDKEFNVYRCDHCNREARIVGRAEEPFNSIMNGRALDIQEIAISTAAEMVG